MMNYKISYAQNREDVILEAFFRSDEIGFYVDVGANDPTIDSVSKRFYDRGWRGINIEPQKRFYDLLCVERPEDININVGVSKAVGALEFREYIGHGLSTFSKDVQKEYEAKPSDITKYKDYKVTVTTLANIFKEHAVTKISFMKVDVEGYEYEVLEGNDWEKYLPEIICIEANHIKKDWRLLLKNAGYQLAFFDGLNNYYVSPKSLKRIEEFSYPESILLEAPVLNFSFAQRLEELEKQNSFVTSQRQLLESELRNTKAALLAAEEQFKQARRIRGAVKSIAYSMDKVAFHAIEKTKYTHPRSKSRKYRCIDLSSAGTENLFQYAKEIDKIDYPPRKPKITRRYRVLSYLHKESRSKSIRLTRNTLHKIRTVKQRG